MSGVIHINSVYSWHCGATLTEDNYQDYFSTTNEKDVNCPYCLELKMAEDYGKYKPSFPRTKFADINTVSSQTGHVLSEAEEACESSYCEGEESWATHEHTAEELLDLIHSAETALFILAEKHGVDLSAIKAAVIKKNRDRGYYSK